MHQQRLHKKNYVIVFPTLALSRSGKSIPRDSGIVVGYILRFAHGETPLTIFTSKNNFWF